MLNPWSVASVHIAPFLGEDRLGSGTGFVVDGKSGPLLITNRHNVTGRDNMTDKQMWRATPDRLEILHFSAELGEPVRWTTKKEMLYTDPTLGESRWLEHPLGPKVDVVAVPLRDVEGIKPIPHVVPTNDFDDLLPSHLVRVIGFPFGLQPGMGALAVWSTGFVATEPTMPWKGLPVFLIDCRARPGQSGSPVVVWELGRSGAKGLRAGLTQAFLGVYSGRINADSDLGIVWKASVVRELVALAP